MKKDSDTQRRASRTSVDQALELSRSRRRSGDLKGAERLLREILDSDPANAAALHDLGVITVDQQGYGDAAEELFRRAVVADRQVAIYHRSLGATLMQRGKLMDAEGPLRQALVLAPYTADAQFNYGSLLFHQKRFSEAEKAFRAAVSLAPKNPVMAYTYGRVLAVLSKTSEAEEAYRRSLSLRPDYFDALVSYSQFLADAGRKEEAEEQARAAMGAAAEDQKVSAAVRFARYHRFQPADPEFSHLESLLAAATSEGDRRSLLSSLAKAYDDIGAYDRAFEHYRAAKEAHAKMTGARFNPESWRKLIEQTRQTFPAPPVFAAERPGAKTTIFVVGLSRAGKSLVESLLVQHPGVFAAGEIKYWEAALQVVPSPKGVREGFPASAERLSADQIRELGEVYLTNIDVIAPSAPFIVETIPRNLLYIGLIFRALPGARVVLCRRDARDQCLSMYFKQYARSFAASYDLADLGTFYQAYERLADHWSEVYGDRVLQVHYEDLVTEPLQTAERLRAYCGLEPPKKPLRARFSRDEIGRWRHYEPYLGRLLDALGTGEDAAAPSVAPD